MSRKGAQRQRDSTETIENPPVNDALQAAGRHEGTTSTSRAYANAPGNERIAAFTDGVFAIAITIMILEVKVPEGIAAGGLSNVLPELFPKLLSHAVSFAVIGIYWIGHHNMFMHIRRHDRVLLWLNVLFLMWISIMPFVSGLITLYGDEQAAVLFYGAILASAGLTLDLIWWYATRHHHLVDPNMDSDLVVFVHRRVLVAPLIYLVAMAASFVNMILAELIFTAVVLYYIVPTRFDHFHHKQVHVQHK